jgi:hypothetical protein
MESESYGDAIKGLDKCLMRKERGIFHADYANPEKFCGERMEA